MDARSIEMVMYIISNKNLIEGNYTLFYRMVINAIRLAM
jgi:hypothetical protein